MDFKDIVRTGFDEYLDYLKRALEGLSADERRFQPAPDSHHIDFTVWHMARVEDDWVQRFAQHADTVWVREGWHEKLGMPEKGSGYGYTAEQVTNLPAFKMDDIMAYYGSVRQETARYLDGLTGDDLDGCPHPDRRPGYTVGKMFSHVIVEESQHVGQVAYIRGVQRGLDNRRTHGKDWDN